MLAASVPLTKVKLHLLGDSGVGKTRLKGSLTRSFNRGPFSSQAPSAREREVLRAHDMRGAQRDAEEVGSGEWIYRCRDGRAQPPS